jgi:hypothetical protein
MDLVDAEPEFTTGGKNDSTSSARVAKIGAGLALALLAV